MLLLPQNLAQQYLARANNQAGSGAFSLGSTMHGDEGGELSLLPMMRGKSSYDRIDSTSSRGSPRGSKEGSDYQDAYKVCILQFLM